MPFGYEDSVFMIGLKQKYLTIVEETEQKRHNERPKQGKEDRGASGLMLSNLAYVKFTWHLPLLIIKQLALE